MVWTVFPSFFLQFYQGRLKIFDIYVEVFIQWYLRESVCGCIILGLSIWIRVTSAQQGMDSSMFAGVDLLIAVGAIIMILGFLGCCGAVRESRCMLMLFFIALLLILILQIIVGILGAVNKSKVESGFDLILSTMVDRLKSTAKEDKQYQEDFLKFQRQTCGEVIIQQIKDNIIIIIGIAFGLAAVEILGLVFSMSLYCQIGRK
ncbi:tetraspanin 8 [Turdus rufiventris]|nr:tetraspanin 8 [Turdus rufiventris]